VRADGIHTAKAADCAELADLHRRSSLVHEDTRELLLTRPDLFGVSPDAVHAGHVRVVIRAGRIVAFATLLPKDGGTFELEDLFVDPVSMRQGLGRALIEDAVARGQVHGGVERIEVTANPNALAFYTAVGFVAEGKVDLEFGFGWRMSLVVPRT
jgi:ribosomal protein S18 acetylase RimI-like enzyme